MSAPAGPDITDGLVAAHRTGEWLGALVGSWSMPGPSASRLLVLHGLGLRGFGAPEAIAAIVGLGADELRRQLGCLATEGLVVYREGRLTGWALTPEGRAEQERLLAGELAATGSRSRVERAYRRFLGLNAELLAACTDFQLRDDAPNDHADPVHDAAAIERLRAVHGALLPVLDELEASLGRYRGYRARFDHALARLGAGDHDWFARPMIDSYHTVWFQLHEDLLNTLGLRRDQESGALI